MIVSRRISVTAVLSILCALAWPNVTCAQALATTWSTNSGWSYVDGYVMGDFDGNGIPDLFVSGTLGFHYIPDLVTRPGVTLGATTVVVPTLTFPYTGSYYPYVGDFNGDGHQDVLIRSQIGSSLYLVPGASNGTFGVPLPWGTLASETGVGIGDFNGDGRADLAVGQGSLSPLVRFLISSPTGGLVSFGTTSSASEPVVGDFDGDGFDDVAMLGVSTSSPSSWKVYLARGSAAGMVLPATAIVVPYAPVLMAVGDFDQDGKDDLVINGGTGAPYNSIAIGHGNAVAPLTSWTPLGTFVNPTVITPNIASVHVADMDSDGWPDLLFDTFDYLPGQTTSRVLAMVRNAGQGQFTLARATTLWMSTPTSASAGWLDFFGGPTYLDLDGDHDVDIFGITSWTAPTNSTVFVTNYARYGAGCAAAAGVPRAEVGPAAPGNPAFFLAVEHAAPFAAAVLAVSTAPAPITPCGLLVDLSPAALILPAPPLGLTATDSTGRAAFTVSLPLSTAGVQVYVQWGILDPTGGFGAGGSAFSLSEGRVVHIF